MSSTEVVSPAARASAISAAVCRMSVLTARPPGSAARRSAAARCAGAPDSACSAVRPGTTTSSRKTLVSGSACDVGGTSSPATPLMDATDSRITHSWGARWSSSASSRSIRARWPGAATSSREGSRAWRSILGEPADPTDRADAASVTGDPLEASHGETAHRRRIHRVRPCRVARALPRGRPDGKELSTIFERKVSAYQVGVTARTGSTRSSDQARPGCRNPAPSGDEVGDRPDGQGTN